MAHKPAVSTRLFVNEVDSAVAIGKEVHVSGWGDGPFFTVRKVEDGIACLSTRYSKRVKYRMSTARCYFTHTSKALATRVAQENTNA